MKVALWGSYGQGNFGDDLMAGVFGKMIRELGHEPYVYDLADIEADAYNLSTSSNLRDCLNGAGAIVMGGGALLKNAQYLRAIVHPVARSLEFKYMELRAEAKRTGIPVIPLSIGSDGAHSAEAVSIFRRRLFSLENCSRGTVRLPGDVALVQQFGLNADYVPDVLFSPQHTAVRQPSSAPPKTVMLNLHRKHAAFVPDILAAVRAISPAATVLACTSHLPGFADYEWVPSQGDRVELASYQGTQSFLNLLAKTDLVISSKLHVGICCMASGGKFLSVGGLGKVRQQLSELNLKDDAYVVPSDIDQRTIEEKISTIIHRSPEIHNRVAELSNLATGHKAVLSEVLSNA